MSAVGEAVPTLTAPSLSTLLEQLSRLEQSSHSTHNAVDHARIHTLVHQLNSHIPPSTSPALSDLFADVGYDILHSLLPLLTPDSLQSTVAGPSVVREVAESVLSCTVLYGSPREVFLPLLSHLSAHVTPLAQRQEEEDEQKQQQPVDERKQPPLVEQPNVPYVLLLLPYFVCLLQREKHATRQASMFRSLSALLAAFFVAVPTDEALTAVLSPLRPVLQADNEAHTGLLLSLLAAYLPPHYPQPSTQPSPAASLLFSLLPDTAVSATFNLATLTTYLRRRQSLTQQLSTMRQQSWELTEDEENITRTQHEIWHAAASVDDEADDEVEAEQDEQERQRRAELRHTKAQLAALPPFPPAGLVCLVLLRLCEEDKREVERLVRGEQGGVAGLSVYVDAMVGTELAGRYRQLMIDFLHRWLSLLPPQSLHYTNNLSTAATEELSADESWMLAECITTLMMQPPLSPLIVRTPHAPASPTSTATTAAPILPLYLSRFTSISRLTLTASLIPACPFRPIQAILVSTLKDLLLTAGDGSERQVAVTVELLVSLLTQWSDVSTVLERVDGLMAALNVLRFVVLHYSASLLSNRRQQIVAAVRLMQQRVEQAEGRENEHAAGKVVDLPVMLLKDLTARVLELT